MVGSVFLKTFFFARLTLLTLVRVWVWTGGKVRLVDGNRMLLCVGAGTVGSGASLPCRWVAAPGRMLKLPEFRGAIF